ncbi:hypothetical protein K435DRAFT_858910 [Dendrothele bispora CBS 962.96]|uniref:Uncharacterized protein n=1 Tax=Dendrothele bispora (strain CBS 962.96) TaxID=1314807 RepID=A0A4S8M323_DENBC|nr:hypothetical protein K435DRAFT_858910 [Dendrothele bispora CBS 962.96]
MGSPISTAVPTSGWRGYGLSGGIWTVFEWRRPSRSKELGVLWREIGLPEKSKWNPRYTPTTNPTTVPSTPTHPSYLIPRTGGSWVPLTPLDIPRPYAQPIST